MNENQFLKSVFTHIETYLEELNDPKIHVSNKYDPERLSKDFGIEIGSESLEYEQISGYINKYLDYSVKTKSKQFHNQLFAGYNIPSLVGEFITALTNTSNYTFEASPLGTLMEMELIRKMSKVAGFRGNKGTFLTGGSNANMIAMLCARQEKFPEIKENGIASLGVLTIFVSETCHYSYEKAANVIGLGINNVRYIKTDSGGSLIPSELEKAIVSSIEAGETPIMIGATAGTTELGAFDPIREMREIADKYSLWLHVDGAWGGSILLSNKHKNLLSGIEKADSMSWDPHKMMNVPLICSVLLVNNHSDILAETVSTERGGYIFHKHGLSDYDLGRSSIQCGKRVDSLKLWLAWKFFGDRGYEKNIDCLFDFASEIVEIINEHPELEMMAERKSLNILFRYKNIKNKNIKDLNSYNLQIRQELAGSGKALCNYCTVGGEFAFRLIVNNPEKTIEDFNQFFIYLDECKELIDNK
jgi:glutamate/tyrosine decarboxylase-like PLP-dependent enzyme